MAPVDTDSRFARFSLIESAEPPEEAETGKQASDREILRS